MSERYETINFNNFSDGEQCDIIAPTEKSFESSNDLVIENNKIKLGKKIKGGALFDSGLEDQDYPKKLSFLYSTYVYLLSDDASNCLIKKCSLADGAYTTVKTLDDSGNDVYCFIKFKGYAIASYLNNANTAVLCKYSNMTMATWADTNLIALAGTDISINDYKIIHDRLYILCSDNKIYYSDNGITFVLLATLDSLYSYNSLEYLAGYLYVVNATNDYIYGLVRISLSGDIQDETISLGSIGFFYHRIFAGKSYILVGRKYLYRVDGSTLVPIFKFDGYAIFIFAPDFAESLFIYSVTGSEIIIMDINEKFSRPYKSLGYVLSFFRYSFAIEASVQSALNKTKVAIYDDAYTTPGDIKTFIARLKGGLGTPVQLVLNHKPLTANAWIKVYMKIDNASAWGSAVITSTDLNAVRKVYSIPAGTECSFIQAKIEYGTDDDSETPEDATLDLIYLPTGLVNSQ